MAKDVRAIRANERYRSVARTLFQLGGALFAGAVVKTYDIEGVSSDALLWSVVAATLMWLGWMTLGLLESEDD